MERNIRRPLWVALYAIAMAAVESAVVVYLRSLHGGAEPLSVLLHEIPDRLVVIEVGREAATLVMIVAVAAIAGRNVWERFLYFAPVIVSLCLVAGALWLLSRSALRLSRRAWVLASVGAVLVLLSFTIDYHYALIRTDPPRFRWEVFWAGIVIAVGGLIWFSRRQAPPNTEGAKD